MWSYLNGTWRRGGWWYYYIYALAIKVPVGTILLFALAIAISCDRRRAYLLSVRDELVVIVVPLAVLVLVSWQSGINIGLRYALPAFPFFFVWMSKVAGAFVLRRGAVACAVVLAGSWSAVSSLTVYPHSLSYFNEFVGGPRNGHLHLLNSNLDWGQDLLYVQRWLESSDVEAAHLAYSIDYINPEDLGLRVERARRQNVVEGWYAISVNHLHGRGGYYAYFANRAPTTTIGYSTRVFYVSEAEAAAWKQE